MFEIKGTIEAFRRGVLDIDCKRMVLTQNKEGGDLFEGQGFIRQENGGALVFKTYVHKHNAVPLNYVEKMFTNDAGKLCEDEAFYDLEAVAHDGTRWNATRILLTFHWNIPDSTVLVRGGAQSIVAHLELPQKHHFLRLHFFEEYQVPLLQWSTVEEHGSPVCVTDRANFEACGAKFEARCRENSGDTTVELTSEAPLPLAFDVRIQEAIQYLTAKPAFWRARLQSHQTQLHLELSSPRRKSAHTRFSPPISPASIHFREHGWDLFGAYLSFVTHKTKGAHWNPVAYHLNNACEATANSIDARAVGISVAVEAVTSLIAMAVDDDKSSELNSYQKRALSWLAEQTDLSESIANRAQGQIKAMANKRTEDTLYRLADHGWVDKNYASAWSYLRHRHVHPKLRDLEKPTSIDMQKLLDNIHMVEVLLRQLTFYLIDYKGPFTDYGTHEFPCKQYPLQC